MWKVFVLLILYNSIPPLEAYAFFNAKKHQDNTVQPEAYALLESARAIATATPSKALTLVDSARQLGHQHQWDTLVMASWQWEYQYYYDKEDWQNAFRAQDSVLHWRNIIQTNKLALAQKQPLELLNQQAESSELRRNLLVQDMALKRRQLMVYTLIIAMVLLLLLLGLLIFRNRTTRQTYAILERRHEEFQERNHELRIQREKLEASEQQLLEVNTAKDQFFTVVAKDLRKPLTTLAAYLSTMIKEASQLSRDELNTLAVKIDGSVRHLWHLIENLLHWSRFQIRSVDSEPSEFSLERAIREQISNIQSIAEEKSIQFHIEVPEMLSSTTVFADRSQTEFVLRNLISNAIKHSPLEGIVKVGVRRAQEKLEVFVQDFGEGISSELIDTLWQDGTQIHSTQPNENQGTGLGLLLSRTYIEKNQGQIFVESETGLGTVFSFTIPKWKAI